MNPHSLHPIHRCSLQLAAALALTAASAMTAGAYPPAPALHSYLGAIEQPTLAAAMKAMPDKAGDDVVKAGDLEISGVWTRAMLPGQPTGGGYFTVTNHGKSADRLLSVSTPVAGRAEIHSMAMKDNVMVMRPVEGGLEIPAGGTVELKPGHLHLMFMEVKEPFRKGETIPLTLEFEKAGKVDVQMPVEAPNAKGAPGTMDHMKMN
ncbi:MAG: copper chaperone PCu(A)C [Rhizobiaceae bacterium]|jgi:copper(I)-binding protein